MTVFSGSGFIRDVHFVLRSYLALPQRNLHCKQRHKKRDNVCLVVLSLSQIHEHNFVLFLSSIPDLWPEIYEQRKTKERKDTHTRRKTTKVLALSQYFAGALRIKRINKDEYHSRQLSQNHITKNLKISLYVFLFYVISYLSAASFHYHTSDIFIHFCHKSFQNL